MKNKIFFGIIFLVALLILLPMPIYAAGESCFIIDNEYECTVSSCCTWSTEDLDWCEGGHIPQEEIENGYYCCYPSGESSKCEGTATCGGSNGQTLSVSQCIGWDSECELVNQTCLGNCDSYCDASLGECADSSYGTDPYEVCTNPADGLWYTCSNGYIVNKRVCGTGPACGVNSIYCGDPSLPCERACVYNSSICFNTTENTDPFNLCIFNTNTSYVCSGITGQTVLNAGVCGASTTCGYSGSTCAGTCNNYCIGGSTGCGNAPTGTKILGGTIYECHGQDIYDMTACNGTGARGLLIRTCSGTTTNYCVNGLSECQSTCPDRICQAGLENASTCFADCGAQGWNLTGTGWFAGSGIFTGYLGNNASVNNFAYGEPFDLKTNTQYNLSARFYITSGASMTVLVNMTCTNASGVRQVCNPGRDSLGYFYVSSGPTSGWVTQSWTFTASSNSNSINNAYFRDVRAEIRYTRTGGYVGPSYVANISLKEIAPSGIYYDSMAAGGMEISGCCPSTHCWDGTKCMNSDLWMNNVSYPPIWNSVMSWGWDNNHVNTSNQINTIGYRCVKNASGFANWTLSRISYDWNYERSGYCAKTTECFVNPTYNYSRYSGSSEILSLGCVPNNTVISDSLMLGQGNHYCYNGSWTSKSYVVATLLQDISKTIPYTLHCYDSSEITNNNKIPFPISNAASVCVLSKNNPDMMDEVLVGVVLEDVSDGSLADFIGEINSAYASLYTQSTTLPIPSADCLTRTPADFGNFTLCADVNNDDGRTFRVYYDQKHKYFIIANYRVSGIEGLTIWQSIMSGLKNLYATITGAPTFRADPYTTINYVTDYDRIYVLRNGTVNVTAIEESKYDETEMAMTTILYVSYNGSNAANNPIDRDEIWRMLNLTIIRDDKVLNVSYRPSTNTQEVIIKTNDRTGLWSYFTSSLRLDNIASGST